MTNESGTRRPEIGKHCAALLALLSAFAVPMASRGADEPARPQATALVPGVYELAEWHTGSSVLRPPEVSGRFIILDGTITTTLRGPGANHSVVTSILVGDYVLDVAKFAYQYQEVSDFIETASGISVSHAAHYPGPRSFTVAVEGATIHMHADAGNMEFRYTADGMTYSADGQVVRVWRRVAKH
jgi:hypothetical protein